MSAQRCHVKITVATTGLAPISYTVWPGGVFHLYWNTDHYDVSVVTDGQ